MKNKLLILALSALTLGACNKNSSSSMDLTKEADKFSYSLGMDVGKNIKDSKIDSINVEVMLAAMRDVMNGDSTKIPAAEAQEIVRAYLTKLQQGKLNEETEKGKKFLEENAKKDGIVTLPSGLQYQVIKAGTGAKPTINDKVTTHYHGTLIDGTVFDSSVERGQPASFPVGGVIAGWTEALQLMPVGSKWKLFVPSALAYGERGAGGAIGPNATLIFEVELLSIDK